MNTTQFTPKISTISEIDNSITTITNIFSTVLEKHTTIHDSTTRTKELPRSIKNEIKTKRRLRTQWQRLRDPAIKTLLNRQTNLVRDLLHSYRENEWSNFIGTIDNNLDGRSKLYKITKNLLHKKPPTNPLKDTQGKLQFDETNKVELFADAMENQFQTPSYNNISDNLINEVVETHSHLQHPRATFFSPKEVWNTIRRLPNRKAPGPDGISNCSLKNCGPKTITKLCQIFNGCIRLEYFPIAWKHANIIMIPKPGKDPKIPINHRPISLLNTISKVFETLLLNRIKIYTMPQIRSEQFGFRPYHSTTLQLLNIIDELVINSNLKKKTAAVLLDVEKAFDKVWHKGLTYKLIQFKIPSQLINIINSFLSNRSFQIKNNSTLSTIRNIHAGVPQGSCLSPHLFLIYVNDIPTSNRSKIALFADDTLFYASGHSNNIAVNNLQKQIDLAEPWFKKWKISINPTKTSAIIFTKKSTENTKLVKIKNEKIKWSNSIKYLGVQIDNKLNFSKHINTTITKAKSVNFKLYPLINSQSSIPIKTRILLYKTYIRPILLYAAPTWVSNLSKRNMTKLESTQSKILRTITGSDWFINNKSIQNSTKIITINEEITKLSKNLKTNILNSPSDQIKNISQRKYTSQRFKTRPIQF